MISAAVLMVALFLAFANGSNDNFKGVATLYGSGTASYKWALTVATIATFAGCLASVYLAETLLKAFSGKGLVPDTVAQSPLFLAAVAGGAAVTVLLATRLGFPVSTTHALTGALVGAGYFAAGSDLNLSMLGQAFFVPLLVSPLLAVVLTMPLYKSASTGATALGVNRESCICVGERQFVPVGQVAFANAGASRNPSTVMLPDVSMGTDPQCRMKYTGRVFGITAQDLVDGLHYISSAAVSFARGLNDTPKIAGLLLVLKALDIKISMIAIAAAMAIGGLIGARRVAETMSHKISRMNDGQALTANLVTALLVIGASRIGVPVSTTHVSVGAISGIGLLNGTADRSVISSILLSWLLTLPVAAVLAGLASWLMTQGS
jgi:PiT family inorganic phosphate transporter